MIVLFHRVSDALERGRRMIKLARNLNPQLRMARDCVIINRDPAIGCDELAAFRQHQRIDFQRTGFDASRGSKQFSN